MRTATVLSFGCLVTFVIGAAALADETTTYEPGPDGVQYKITRRVVQRSIPTTEYQTREQKVYRPQVTTDYQTYQQLYATPVTEYRMVSRLRGAWNPFSQPYWTHNIEPVTRWETRPGTVQVPTARTDWVEETRTTQVPVTTYRSAPEEVIVKTPVSVAPSSSPGVSTSTSVASRPAGQRMESDPPRDKSAWSSSNPYEGGIVR